MSEENPLKKIKTIVEGFDFKTTKGYNTNIINC